KKEEQKMKNKLVAIGIGTVVGLLIAFGALKLSTPSSAASLSLEEAKKIATDQFPGTVVENELEREGSRSVYEIEIEGEHNHYELKLDGDTGEILKLEEKSIKATNKTEVALNDDDADDQKGDDDADDKDDQKSNDEDKKEQTKTPAPQIVEKPTNNTNKNVEKDDDADDKKPAVKDNEAQPIKDAKTGNGSKNKGSLPIIQAKAIQIAKAEVGAKAVVKEI